MGVEGGSRRDLGRVKLNMGVKGNYTWAVVEAEEVSCVKTHKDYLTERLLDELRTEGGSHSPPRILRVGYATELEMLGALFVAQRQKLYSAPVPG